MEFCSGEILIDPHFQYPTTKKLCVKYLLILNKKPTHSQNVVIVPSTTNKHNIPYYAGCNDDIKVFYFDDEGSFYKKGSIIQLEFINILDLEWLEDMIEKQGILRTNKMISKTEFSQIINCIKKIKTDIAVDIQELIF